MARLTVADSAVDLAALAAARITELIEGAVAEQGEAFVSLTGGSTPRTLYSTLSDARQPWRDRIPWSHVHLFWGDERHVPPHYPDSNYGMAKATLLDQVPIPVGNVHRICGELPDAADAAADYERTLLSVAKAVRRKTLFDVMLLGVGEDAHIASIFPGTEMLECDTERHFTGRPAAAVWAAHLNAWRITLTPPAILDSRAIVMLVSGSKKADAVYAALKAPLDVEAHPVQLLRVADDRVEWFLDRAAAARV